MYNISTTISEVQNMEEKNTNNIKKYRLAAGMKQIELCKILGITQGALSGWENGKYEPDIKSLSKMAELFHTTIDELMGLKSESTPRLPTDQDDIVIVCRNGKQEIHKLTPEQLESIDILLDGYQEKNTKDK